MEKVLIPRVIHRMTIFHKSHREFFSREKLVFQSKAQLPGAIHGVTKTGNLEKSSDE